MSLTRCSTGRLESDAPRRGALLPCRQLRAARMGAIRAVAADHDFAARASVTATTIAVAIPHLEASATGCFDSLSRKRSLCARVFGVAIDCGREWRCSIPPGDCLQWPFGDVPRVEPRALRVARLACERPLSRNAKSRAASLSTHRSALLSRRFRAAQPGCAGAATGLPLSAPSIWAEMASKLVGLETRAPLMNIVGVPFTATLSPSFMSESTSAA